MRAKRWTRPARLLSAGAIGMILAACVRTPPPVEPTPPPPVAAEPAPRPEPSPEPPPPVPPPTPVPIVDPDDDFETRSLEELNRDSPLDAVFFGYDSAVLNADGREVLQRNADVLVRQATWVITVEGHCDERGTPEYNLGLGERRALAVRDHLITLGVNAGRIRTVSYGKEFPFDPGHDEAAWAANRRAHFVITER